MFWLAIIIIAGGGILGDMYSKKLKYKEKSLKIEAEILQKQLKLEQIKHENFKLETEKLRLELSEDFNRIPTKDNLLEMDLTKKR